MPLEYAPSIALQGIPLLGATRFLMLGDTIARAGFRLCTYESLSDQPHWWEKLLEVGMVQTICRRKTKHSECLVLDPCGLPISQAIRQPAATNSN
jgi:hypothetical protein